MPRPPTRVWKRAVSAGGGARTDAVAITLARESALLLLRRSVDMGHRRLALIRLLEAVRVQAPVPPEHWAHCRAIAAGVPDPELRAAYLAAEHRASLPPIA
jgi:hypothetical protein